MENIFKEINDFSSEKLEHFSLGRFCYVFLSKHPIFIDKLIPHIEISLKSRNFQTEVMRTYTDAHIKEKVAIQQEFEAKRYHPNAALFYMPQLELVEKKLDVKTIPQLIDYLENNLNEYPGTLEILNNFYKSIHGKDGFDYIKDNYIYYYIGDILYSKYLSIKGRADMLDLKYSKVVKTEYEKIGIDICQEDVQFSKYSLISMNKNIEIFNNKDSQTIRDDRIGKHFWIDIPRKLLTTIEELIKNKMLLDVSFRIDYVSDYLPAMEEKEFGTPLRLKISSLPELSKFYSTDKYENNLWVRHDVEKQSLTFEEMMADFEVIGEDIVTQVIHLEYKAQGEHFFITHLDHEFIIYTLDNYQERLSDANIKGHRKVKTFKIDNSMIPFNIKINGELFLVQVLDSYFKNYDLIHEYFSG
ncbi:MULTISPECIES: hypothetical protein [Acinetobacter]|nr:MULTISPECIES: hypothetical protein [Acinetobacter]EKW4080639.1 hypothetical protein [Acinetobacter baumannii]MDV7388990.1 hypothetical protein [Acinetobacter baumannii]QVR67364.1 hypothetical protein KIP84_15145 [Acinetobacter sp. BHS4]